MSGYKRKKECFEHERSSDESDMLLIKRLKAAYEQTKGTKAPDLSANLATRTRTRPTCHRMDEQVEPASDLLCLTTTETTTNAGPHLLPHSDDDSWMDHLLLELFDPAQSRNDAIETIGLDEDPFRVPERATEDLLMLDGYDHGAMAQRGHLIIDSLQDSHGAGSFPIKPPGKTKTKVWPRKRGFAHLHNHKKSQERRTTDPPKFPELPDESYSSYFVPIEHANRFDSNWSLLSQPTNDDAMEQQEADECAVVSFDDPESDHKGTMDLSMVVSPRSVLVTPDRNIQEDGSPIRQGLDSTVWDSSSGSDSCYVWQVNDTPFQSKKSHHSPTSSDFDPVDDMEYNEPTIRTLTSFPFRILSVNPAFTRLTGRTSATDIVGRSIYKVLSSAERKTTASLGTSPMTLLDYFSSSDNVVQLSVTNKSSTEKSMINCKIDIQEGTEDSQQHKRQHHDHKEANIVSHYFFIQLSPFVVCG